MNSDLTPTDRFGRGLSSLRISITDRCNLRCRYCMPEDEYVWLPKESILTYEEMVRLVRVFASVGVHKVRLTGGEPLLRHDIADLIAMVSGIDGITDLALTTNGVLLEKHAASIKAAGLNRVTVSLDTLVAERYKAFAKGGSLTTVVRGIDAAKAVGFENIKLNSVVIRGFNEDELQPLLEFGAEKGVEVRFIEYMDVGGATDWSLDKVVSEDDILESLSSKEGAIEVVSSDEDPTAPARRFRTASGYVFGVVASTTKPFCSACDRARLTADGTLYRCLYAVDGVDLRKPLRAQASDGELAELLRGAWVERKDRGAEERAGLEDRGALHPVEALKLDPRREMHTRGG